ncbi:hypothetical protein [Pseudoduganella armeniaca]|uniref:hypothetical protein n=1 Tax=Pseudoduganella armeniaca TaxID=2072590 RepID=UPI0011B1D4FF|nr:hypothetical protein [Pseudoduganella armeniaca]
MTPQQAAQILEQPAWHRPSTGGLLPEGGPYATPELIRAVDRVMRFESQKWARKGPVVRNGVTFTDVDKSQRVAV